MQVTRFVLRASQPSSPTPATAPTATTIAATPAAPPAAPPSAPAAEAGSASALQERADQKIKESLLAGLDFAENFIQTHKWGVRAPGHRRRFGAFYKITAASNPKLIASMFLGDTKKWGLEKELADPEIRAKLEAHVHPHFMREVHRKKRENQLLKKCFRIQQNLGLRKQEEVQVKKT
eukprot:TRINITY_DN8907_c0_g1_i1.p1 TRINITY_DN8907_c0_g1~~TRINITY_DN8907_c0_g1_i1.p1  ORF type:complete len:178 (-),score=63.81 TRINITY_DN8907_c0_g1_i1:155-688(-)